MGRQGREFESLHSDQSCVYEINKCMLYTIYKTTNLVNGKYYIGKHQTLDPNDRYLGSGKALLQAITKYGRSNFSKEVLFIFETENEMNQKEKELVTAEFIATDSNYNAGVGGEGGPQFRGRTHSAETRAILSEKASRRITKDETRAKISEANRNRKVGGWKRPDTAARNSLRKINAGRTS